MCDITFCETDNTKVQIIPEVLQIMPRKLLGKTKPKFILRKKEENIAFFWKMMF